MKDLTHYFADPSKVSETHSTVSNCKEVNDIKLSEKSTKTNSTLKKRGRKKSKSTSPNFNAKKKNKCELNIEIIKSESNGKKDSFGMDNAQDIPQTNCVQEIQEKTCVETSKNLHSEENENKLSPQNSDSKKIDDTAESQQNEQKINDLVQNNENSVCIVEDDEKKENNDHNGISHEQIKNKLDPSLETVEPEASVNPEERKKRRKENVKALADKKGFAKRKQVEDKETEEMEKTLLSRKNVFTNVPKRDENQPEIVIKPPAYSLLNYFSKSTPEQRLKEEAAKCKISVKAEVHTKEDDTNTTPNSTPTSRPKNSQKKKAEMKKALSQIDDIQFIRSESISPPPVLQEKKKTNKPKWRIQFQSDNFSDCGTDSETLSPKRKLKTQNKNRKSDEVVNGKEVVLKSIENSKSENSDTETIQLNQTRRSLRCKERKKIIDISEIDDHIKLEKKKKVKTDKTKKIDSKLNDNDESSDIDIIIVKEIEPKRLAPEKIAPLFIKKRKLDPAVLEARRMFLQSDMVENENRPIKRKPSPVRNPVLPFPKISHITQLDSEIHETNEIKLRLKSSSEYLLPLDASKFSKIITDNCLHVERSLTTFDSVKLNINIEESLCEIETRCNDARTMWNSISMIGKGENPKKSPKIRTSKRRSSNKKIVNTEEEEMIDNIWIHKYKPRSIDEIVGNEQSASKLKNWLEKWKLPSNKSSVDSDDDFYSSDCSSTCSSNDNNQVAILIGPYGCGKTASVYAAAEELGYSVLEINASSRRTGKKILKELEEATKSHRIKKSNMKQTFLKSKIEEKKIPQNSLILMEDVNIVFEEDEGFISAAYQLASNTKRPIVMTCSEACSHLVKLAPQQIQIKFHAPAGDRVSALLELISLAETGRKLSLSCVENLMGSGDLRKALLQLQYLLATGDSHVLPLVVDTNHRNGISLWQKIPQCVYKPAVKESKRRKKISQESHKDVDVLTEIANNLENVSLISKLIELEDISVHHRNMKSVMSLSITEDMRPYSHSNSISSNIADWLTREIIHKKDDTEQNTNKIFTSLLKRRKANNGINSVLSTIALTTDQKILSEDYLPCIRTICRAEEARNSSNNKRGNRFFHYLNGTKLPSNSSNILSASCKIFQEKSEQVN